MRQLEVANRDHVAGEIRAGISRCGCSQRQDRPRSDDSRDRVWRVISPLIPIQGASTLLGQGLERIGSGVRNRNSGVEPGYRCDIREQ